MKDLADSTSMAGSDGGHLPVDMRTPAPSESMTQSTLAASQLEDRAARVESAAVSRRRHTAGFDLEEYKALRAEVLAKIEAARQNETYAVAGAAAVYAWLAKLSPPSYTVWLIPVIFPLLGALRNRDLSRQLALLGEYLYELESEGYSADEATSGWEHFRRANPGRFAGFSARVFWLVFLALTLLLSGLLFANAV